METHLKDLNHNNRNSPTQMNRVGLCYSLYYTMNKGNSYLIRGILWVFIFLFESVILFILLSPPVSHRFNPRNNFVRELELMLQLAFAVCVIVIILNDYFINKTFPKAYRSIIKCILYVLIQGIMVFMLNAFALIYEMYLNLYLDFTCLAILYTALYIIIKQDKSLHESNN